MGVPSHSGVDVQSGRVRVFGVRFTPPLPSLSEVWAGPCQRPRRSSTRRSESV